MRSSFKAASLLIALWMLAPIVVGCGDNTPDPLLHPDLPDELTDLFPDDATIVHRESGDEPIPYDLWLIRGSSESFLDLPAAWTGLETHELPESILRRLFEAKASGTQLGASAGGPCRFTHWSSDQTEFQARELVTDRGWFATLERFTGDGRDRVTSSP